MKPLDDQALEQVLFQVQEKIRGPVPKDEWIVLDGKPPRQEGGPSVRTALTVPSQHDLGSAMRDTQTNEIPVARQLFQKLDLDGRQVSLDALPTQAQPARALVLEHGADYLLTVKDNPPTLRLHIERLVNAPPAQFSPAELTPTLAGRLRSPRSSPRSVCCAAGRPARRRWDFPGWSKSCSCAHTSAGTPPKS